MALGSSPGDTDIYPFDDVPSGALFAIIRGLDLSRERHVFSTIKGFNAAGVYSTATSSGVYMTRISAGKTPLGMSRVYDGIDLKADL